MSSHPVFPVRLRAVSSVGPLQPFILSKEEKHPRYHSPSKEMIPFLKQPAPPAQ